MRFFHQAFVACTTINRKYQIKIILVIHVPDLRKIFCSRKLQRIVGQVKGYKLPFRQLKKIFVSSLKHQLAVLIPVALNSVV